MRTYRRLAKGILLISKQKTEVDGIFPGAANYSTEALDRVETGLIKSPLRKVRYLLGKFSFLQNGRLQNYILYGLLFVVLALGLPFLYQVVRLFINYLNTL